MSGGTRARRLPRRFYERDALLVAPDLLGKVLVRTMGGVRRGGRIVEVEAYRGADDPASHAYRGLTPRTATMFGPGGRLYVYLSYGMHHCANVVCGPEGEAMAVLLRALVPLDGLPAMAAARGPGARRPADYCSGPGKLGQAMALDRTLDGADLVTDDRGVTLVDDGVAPPARPSRSGRIGLSAGADVPWRWWVPGEPSVSAHRRAVAVP